MSVEFIEMIGTQAASAQLKNWKFGRVA